MPRFTANISLLFKEHDFLDRPAAAAAAGFTGIECQFPYHVAAEDFADKLTVSTVPLVMFNAPPGDWAAGERGLAALPGREAEFRDSLDVAMAYADATECARLHVMAGIVPEDAIDEALETYMANLAYAADQCDAEGITVLIEPLSGLAGYLLTRPDQAVEIIRAVDRKNLRLQYDLYHAQRTRGSLSEFIENNLDLIAHIQVAGVPGRHEPDKLGEINWRFLFDLLDAHGYDGWVGAEYAPRGETILGLAWARDWGIGVEQSSRGKKS
jgi:hydroxypyruvate isomerase